MASTFICVVIVFTVLCVLKTECRSRIFGVESMSINTRNDQAAKEFELKILQIKNKKSPCYVKKSNFSDANQIVRQVEIECV